MNPYRNRDIGSEYQSGILDMLKGAGQYLYDQTVFSPQHPYNRFSKRFDQVGLLENDPVMDQIVEDMGMGLMGGTIRPVRPVRQDQLAKAGLQDNPGGRYMTMEMNPDGPPSLLDDITGKTFQGMNINTQGGRRSMTVDDEKLARQIVADNSPKQYTPQEKLDSKLGPTFKVNLIDSKRSKWEWTDADGVPVKNAPDPTDTLVSVHNSSRGHFYTLNAEYDTPVTMKTYPREKSEPRLMPSTRGELDFSDSNVIGYAKKSGHVKPVYDKIRIVPK